VFSVDLCTNDYIKTVGPLYPQQCFLTVGDVVGDDLRRALRTLSAINIKPISLTLYWNKGPFVRYGKSFDESDCVSKK
jgi:hypothetical protein